MSFSVKSRGYLCQVFHGRGRKPTAICITHPTSFVTVEIYAAFIDSASRYKISGGTIQRFSAAFLRFSFLPLPLYFLSRISGTVGGTVLGTVLRVLLSPSEWDTLLNVTWESCNVFTSINAICGEVYHEENGNLEIAIKL